VATGYLKYGKILGETTGKYKGWISLNSIQWGVDRGFSSALGTNSSRPGAMPNISEIVVTKNFDSISVLLSQEALSGAGVKATIELVERNDRVYLRVELEDAMISGYSLGHGDKLTESLSINFAKMNYHYTAAPVQ